jgi:hypothetical protein
MSPITLLKEGIVEEDWDKVKLSYKTLTGEDLAVIIKSHVIDADEAYPVEEDEDEISDTAPLPSLLTDESEDVVNEEDYQDEVNEVDEADEVEDIEAVRCRRIPFPVEKRKNKFKDSLSVASKDLDFDKKVRTKESVTLHNQIVKRKPVQKVKVKCNKCNKEKIIEDPYSIPRFRKGGSNNSFVCNSCISRQRGKD